MEYIYLFFGLLLLLYSGNLLVKGGVALAQHFRVSSLVVGVTVVSFGTSAPELFVSLDAALFGSPDISVGNVVGSNISNIALVLGLTALLLPLPVQSNSIKFDWPVMMGASLLFFAFVQDYYLEFWEGALFIVLLVSFLAWTIRKSRKQSTEISLKIRLVKLSVFAALMMIILSSAGLYFGAHLLVNGAKNIALTFGMSERVVGLTLVAVGTSVPELATSLIAAFKKQLDISVGNIIGSNIYNIFGVLGATSIIKSIHVSSRMVNFDILWMLAISFLLLLMLLPLKQGKIHRWKGAILVTVYIVYVYMVFVK